MTTWTQSMDGTKAKVIFGPGVTDPGVTPVSADTYWALVTRRGKREYK